MSLSKHQQQNKQQQQQQQTNPNGFAIYKGIHCPIVVGEKLDFARWANTMIVSGLRDGISLDKQGDAFIKQMDKMEETLNRAINGKQMTKHVVKDWIIEMEREEVFADVDEEKLFVMWNMNIHALMKLRRITKNADFGIHYPAPN
jgi:hypothetical protein